MEKIQDLFFYTIDKTIKTHRQYSQNRLRKRGYSLTIDQWLLLSAIAQDKEMSQNQLAEMIFKDKASINRMIEPLMKRKLLKKEGDAEDKRKNNLQLTPQGKKMLEDIRGIVLETRRLALEGVSEKEIAMVKKVLFRILENCDRYFDS